MLTFNKQFFSIYRKFNLLESENLLFLFKYCLSFYSATNWYNLDNCKTAFKTLQTLYHKHIKRILRVNKRYSNHIACKEANIHTFPHLINIKVMNHMRKFVFSNNSCCKQLKYYFQFNSIIVKMFIDKFEREYGISDIFNNDLDALHSRVKFTEDREPISSWHDCI